MANNICDYLEGKWINMLKGTAYTAPTVYAAIISDTATDADMEDGLTTNEITGYTGTRPAVTFGASAQISDKETIKNSAVVDYVSMPAPAGRLVKYVLLMDAASGGNALYWCPLSATKTWNTGDTFRISIDGLVVDLA
jgi:hypothetical protein